MKRLFSLILSFILLMGLAMPVMADESASARTVVIFQVEGSGAKMTKGAEKEFSAKAGLKLFEGYTVATGDDSYVYLKLDDSSLIKIEPKSKISISKASSNKLSVTVLNGAITANAHEQKEGQVMEIRAGNSALAIRGTLFTVEQPHNGNVAITMIDGSGYVDGHYLPAGNVMDIFDEKDKLDKRHVLRKSEINEDTSAVVLRAILENQVELSDNFTEEDFKEITELLKTKEQEEKEMSNQSNTNAAVPTDKNSNYYRDEKTAAAVENDDDNDDDDDGDSNTPPPSGYVAYIGSTGYLSVVDAISAAVSGEEIRVTSSASIGVNSSIISGVTLTVESPATLRSDADLTVNGTLKVANGATFKNNGVLTNNSNNTVNIDGDFYNYAMLENALTGKTAIGATGTLYLGGTSTFKNEGNLEVNGQFTGSNGGKFYFGSGASLTGTSNALVVTPDFWYIINTDGKLSPFPVYNQISGTYYATISEAIADSSDYEVIRVSGNLTETASGNITIPSVVMLDIAPDVSVTLTCAKFVNNGYIAVGNGSTWNLTASDVFENNAIIEIYDADVNFNCEVLNNFHIQVNSSSSYTFSVNGMFTNYTLGSVDIIKGNVFLTSGLVNYGVLSLEDGDLSVQGESDVVAISPANISPIAGDIAIEPAPATPTVFINGNGASQTPGRLYVAGGNFVCKSIDNQYGVIELDGGYADVRGNIYNTGGLTRQSGPLVIIGIQGALSVSRNGFYTQGIDGAAHQEIKENKTYHYINDAGGGEPGWYDTDLPQ